MLKTENKTVDIFGTAMQAYFPSANPEDIIVHSPNFEDDNIPVSYLFRKYWEMASLEQTALKNTYGSVLDVGCGAGSHALHLQEKKNLQVLGIDTSAGAIEICKKRGLKHAENIAFENLSEKKFDTILFLMNGTGIIGRLQYMDRFFEQLKKLLKPSGQVLLDSSDLSYLFDPDEDGGIWVHPDSEYYGEMQYQLSYKNKISPVFDWLYLDYNTLQLAATKNGFRCEKLQKGPHYDYLAKLTLIP